MKASFVLAINLVLSVAVVIVANECHNICADVKKGVSFKSGCSAFRNALPRPKVSSKCQAGFKAAVDVNCYDACVNGGRLQPFVSERRLDEVCKGALKETPRPLCHDACVRGYRSGVKDMSTLLAKHMAEVTPTVLAALKEDAIARQAAQKADVTGAADVAEAEGSIKLGGFTEAEVDTPSDQQKPDSHDEDVPEGRIIEDAGEAGMIKHEETQGVNAKPGEPGEVKLFGEDSAQSIPEVEQDKLDVIGNADSVPATSGDGVKYQLQETANEDATTQDEHAFMWIENEEYVLLSLPITIDNVQKELAIFEGEDPMEAVLEFCRDNMPEEGAACADELIRVVQDKLSPEVSQME